MDGVVAVNLVGMTLLSDPADAVIDLVFVHGLQGHPQNTWTFKPSKKDSKQQLSPTGQRRNKGMPRALRFFSRERSTSRSGTKKDAGEGTKVDENTEGEAGLKEIFWPKDLLAKDFLRARIMTFGYNSKVTQGYKAANQGSLFSHANDLLYAIESKRRKAITRDLVFIAHSLGGILVKEVLRRSEADKDTTIKKIFESTTGVFFFGTPHRGSQDWASFGEGVAQVAGMLLAVDTNTRIIRALLPDNELLALGRDSFISQWLDPKSRLTVRTFQESKGITGVSLGGSTKLIVPPDSSTLDHPSQRPRTIDRDHRSMCKFTGSTDPAYEMVKGDIEELVSKAKEAGDSQGDKPWSQTECNCQQELRTSDYEGYKERNPDRVKGTCKWLLQHPNFEQWQQSSTSSLLWVSADPGCGKSVLSKSLVDKDLKSTNLRTTCYFFFKDDDIKQKSVNNALCALLHQIFSQKRFLIRYATPEYEKEGKNLPESLHKLWTILTNAAADPRAGEIVCILDALDECAESGRYDIIRILKDFYKAVNKSPENPSKLKFLVTSRPYFDIERRFTELTHNMPSVHLKGEKESKVISDEINLVIQFEVHEKLGRELKLNDDEKSVLELELSSMPHRTYLWLKLILEEIRLLVGVSKKELQRTVSQLPTTVYEAYEAILKKSSDKIRARKLLCIVVAAVRPLTLKEMNIALAIEDGHRSSHDLDLEDETRFEGTIRHLCGLFISVVDQKVYLIHQTAKEFLLARPGIRTGEWKCSIEPELSELVIARTCINYLLFTDFNVVWGLEDEDENNYVERMSKVELHTDNYHYLSYTASQWGVHFQKAQVRAEYAILQSVLHICDVQSHRFRNWFYIYWNLDYWYRPTPQLISSIMVGSYLGHEVIVKLLVEREYVEADSKDESGRTPLSWAAGRGHEAVVKLLVERDDVEADSKDKSGRTPLLWAAGSGHEAVVKLLVERDDVEADSKDKSGRTPLSWAAGRGHEAVVKLLVERDDVEADSKDKDGRTPLSLAAARGHKAVVKLLIERDDVEADSKDTLGRTPLSRAVESGHEAVVKLLIERDDVEADLKDKNGQTPLSWAAESGHEAVVKLLIERDDVEADLKDKNGQTPLSWAAESGHEAVVKLLIERDDVKADSKDKGGRTPLSWAVESGHEAVVKLLVERDDVEADSKDKYGQTPLSHAADWGHEAVVKLLVERDDVEADSKDKYGQTPLSYAATRGQEAVVKLLDLYLY